MKKGSQYSYLYFMYPDMGLSSNNIENNPSLR